MFTILQKINNIISSANITIYGFMGLTISFIGLNVIYYKQLTYIKKLENKLSNIENLLNENTLVKLSKLNKKTRRIIRTIDNYNVTNTSNNEKKYNIDDPNNIYKLYL